MDGAQGGRDPPRAFHWAGGFLGGADGEESACNAEGPGSLSGSGQSPGEGNGNPLQCSCLQNSMDRGAWWGPWGCKESVRTKRLSTAQGQQTFFLGSHAYQFPSDSHLPFCALKETVMIRRITSVQFSSFTVILAYIYQSVVSLVTITQHLLGDLDQLRTQGQPGVHSHAELRVRLYIAHGLSIKVLPP